MNTERRKELAEKFRQNINDWQYTGYGYRETAEEKKKTRAVYAQDRKDMRKVLSAFRKARTKAQWEEVESLASSLDTILRDGQVPEEVWEAIDNNVE